MLAWLSALEDKLVSDTYSWSGHTWALAGRFKRFLGLEPNPSFNQH